jgi:type I restriction enzyme, S subunit
MSRKKVKLGEICTIEKGAIGIQKAIPGEYPLVITGDGRKSHNEFQFDCEAVIIPLVSGTGHGHASIKRIHFQTGKFAVGNILCAVIPKDSKQLSAEYLFRFLDLNKEKELVSRMKGMANVTLPVKEIAQIEIPLPTIEEQYEFVEMFKDLETKSSSLTSELTHQLTLVKKLRQQLLQDAVQGKLIKNKNLKIKNDETGQALLNRIKAEKEKSLPSGAKRRQEKELPPIKLQEIPFEIPENWVWCRLGEIIKYTENKDIQKHHAPETIINYVDIDAIDNQKQVIREVKQKYVSELSTRARRVLKNGYIMYSTVRP